MVQYKKGDILREESEALVNTVNCVGVMGRGIALQFKKAFPENFKAYEAACKREEIQPGKMFVFETNSLTPPKLIINFPTKRHWRGKSRIEDIRLGLIALTNEIRERNIKSIAIPPLGSGLGGLNWEEVKVHIESALKDLQNLEVVIFEPAGPPKPEAMVKSQHAPKMTEGRAALISLMRFYLAGLMDPFLTLLEVHKLMYFLQEVGQPLKLNYQKGLYGPYAENLRHVLNEIEGYFISGYSDGKDAPEKELKLIPGAIVDAESFLINSPETRARLQRVANLVVGFETPFGLELLSTVHWVTKKLQADSIDDIIKKTYAWGSRKKQFTERQINIAYEVLNKNNMLN